MLEQRVLDFFEESCPLRPGDALLVAVSGGPDSVALLHLLLAVRDNLSVRLDVAHLDHGLRGAEGDEDQRFVEGLAHRERLAFHTRRIDLASRLEEEGGSVEAMARRERYAFFEEARAVAGARWIVTGHSADDQVETFLLNLIRGAGPRGLGGMLAVGPGSVCRPLLTSWREEILAFLEDRDLPYRTDSTNEDISLTRNRIRHRLVPFLSREFGSGVGRILARESQLMNDLDAFLNLESNRILKEAAMSGGSDELRLEVEKLRSLHPALQRSVVRAGLEGYLGGLQDIHLDHLDAVLDLAGREGGGSADLPRSVRVVREYGSLVFTSPSEPPAKPEASPPLALGEPGSFLWGGTHVSWRPVSSAEVDPASWANRPDRACFDLDRVVVPVYVRGLREGDRIEPFGMEGSCKVSDLLIDRKVPRRHRTRVGLLCDNGGPAGGERILWVLGQRQARHASIGPSSSQVVLVEAESIV